MPGKHMELEEQFLLRTKHTSVDISLLASTQSACALMNFCPITTLKVQVNVTTMLSYFRTGENHFPVSIFSDMLPFIGLQQLVWETKLISSGRRGTTTFLLLCAGCLQGQARNDMPLVG